MSSSPPRFKVFPMKKFVATHLPTAHTLAGIAHELLLETRQAATTRVSDLRSQVEELWLAAGDMAKPTELMRHVETTLEVLQKRDLIGFPAPLKA